MSSRLNIHEDVSMRTDMHLYSTDGPQGTQRARKPVMLVYNLSSFDLDVIT